MWLKLINEVNSYKEFEELRNFFSFLHKDKDEGGIGVSITQMSKTFNKDRRTISTWFRKSGLIIRTDVPVRLGVLTDEQLQPFTESIDGVKFKKIPFAANRDMLWVLGFSLGEGSFSSGTLVVGNRNFSLLPILKKILSNYGSISIHYDNLYSKTLRNSNYDMEVEYVKDVPKKFANYFRIKLYNSAFSRMIKNEFTRINKDTISFALSSKENIKSFLAGFWDADGYITSSFYLKRKRKELNLRIGFKQKDCAESRWLTESIKRALKLHFNIESRIVERKEKRTIFKNGETYIYDGSSIGLVIGRHKDARKWVIEFKDFLKDSEKLNSSYKILNLGN
jgi:hypothetical protein